MAAAFREQVKDILAAFTVFIEETLVKEKLSGKAEDERNSLKKTLDNIKEEFPALKSESDWARDNSGSTPDLYVAAAKSNAVSANDLLSQAKIHGFLKKKSEGLMGKLKKKWCGIKDETFYIYDKPNDKKQRGQIDLVAATIKKYEGGKKAPPFGFEVSSPSTGTDVFFASNETELRSWLAVLGYQEQGSAPIEPSTEDGDDMELYEEFDAPPNVIPKKPNIIKPVPPVADDDEDDDIYEEDSMQPIQPAKQSKPLPPQPKLQPVARVDSEIYEDTADPIEDPDEIYDDVEAAPVAAPVIRPPRKEPFSQPKKPLPELPVINYEDLYYALWSRTGDQPDELSFGQADILLVRNKIFDKHSWWAAESNGKVGYVPKNFLTPVYVPVK